MGFTFNTDDIQIKPRTTNVNNANVNNDFDKLIEIYHKYNPYT